MSYPKGLPLHTIWDDIAFFLESTKDLLSLALTCHTFKDLVIPDHIRYRHIYCDIRSPDWILLESRPRLARGIRSVELAEDDTIEDDVGTSDPFSDEYFHTPVTIESLTLFTNSISHMAFLKEFTWTQLPESIQQVVNISDVLMSSAARLEGLSIEPYLSHCRSTRLQFEQLSVDTRLFYIFPSPF
ncbi:hypothetical protein Clacol_007026 [Clathrus columnatus]|uniref:F-box domain-containing protein n=1 Tax=Clathrus columnatus TaxID=1419009 RepID=A0AAV5ADS3_9AGAM|nr:hypothetical protein Clacol_007026 [Clathrus columnatus]